ncbi:hypothetical protein [Streptomyces xanthochromogenes]|uniref:Secreted protein n=1 Tax=Streptomyces xanthochromogenes TaxID=67384 RepID=A0ABQ3ATP3_9ACTN|nr:hypothetical protein [Streptomyces xanthochromogenes]GGY65749.1 hypothetical protein GCM10010326_70440 [Streptomyces xanthochromogenes]
MSAGTERMFWGVMVLAVSLGLLALLAIYWSMPSTYRASIEPPTDRNGYSYTCYCWRSPVRVTVRTEPPRPRRRHARLDQPPQVARSSPPAPDAGADCGQEGAIAPVPVAV